MLLEPAELTGPPPRERRPALCVGQSVQTVTAAGEAAERCRGAAAAVRGTRPVGRRGRRAGDRVLRSPARAGLTHLVAQLNYIAGPPLRTMTGTTSGAASPRARAADPRAPGRRRRTGRRPRPPIRTTGR